jgi:ABC-type lipoprotein export system ATPase subunit
VALIEPSDRLTITHTLPRTEPHVHVTTHSITPEQKPESLVTARAVARSYPNGVHALASATFEIARGEFVAITGPSGCGKSTLLHLLGGLDSLSSGELTVDGLHLQSAGDRELTRYRQRTVGIVFQFFHLLPTMTALENTMLPRLLQGDAPREVRSSAQALLARVGMSDRAGHFPHQLSGGQMQRVAIARALIAEPKLLLADEPTGNLDTAAAEQVLEVLQEIASQGRTTLIVVTHSAEVAQLARRQLRMRDGHLLADT